jgi:SecD/SecF fusion protein
MPRWLFAFSAVFVGFLLLAIASFVVLPWITWCFLPNVGNVLVYEMVDLKPTQDPSDVAAKTAKALNLRLNPGMRRQLATVKVVEGNRIEVGVYGNDPTAVHDVAEIVENAGTLEFRIVANLIKHKAEIEAAKSAPEKDVFRDRTGEWSARWVRVRDSEKFNEKYNLVRTRTVNDRPISEVLVVRDPYDVTGDFLANAKPGGDQERPSIEFVFNKNGGRLFAELTGENRPDSGGELKNQLAIILNGVVYSAPNILSTISDRGQITGNFTEREVHQIVDVLNAGSLPARLRKVEQRKADPR